MAPGRVRCTRDSPEALGRPSALKRPRPSRARGSQSQEREVTRRGSRGRGARFGRTSGAPRRSRLPAAGPRGSGAGAPRGGLPGHPPWPCSESQRQPLPSKVSRPPRETCQPEVSRRKRGERRNHQEPRGVEKVEASNKAVVAGVPRCGSVWASASSCAPAPANTLGEDLPPARETHLHASTGGCRACCGWS